MEVEHMAEAGTLVPFGQVKEIVARRDAAIAAYGDFFRAIDAAHQHLLDAQANVSAACGSGTFQYPYVENHRGEIDAFKKALTPPDVRAFTSVAQRLTDIQVWEAIIARTQLDALMDCEAKDERRKQMAYVPERVDGTGAVINQAEIDRALPPVTVGNVVATLEQFAKDSGRIWRRGIANAFTSLDRRFRSHDGFKIKHRIIFERAFDDCGMWSHWGRGNHRDRLLDVERVFQVLDGREPTTSMGGIIGLIDQERRGSHGKRESVHDGDYFRVRIFKNGNMHLWFQRHKLVDKVNQLLAEHYAEGLGWGTSGEEAGEAPRAGSAALSRPPARHYGEFFTPDELADRVITEADLRSDDPLEVLEPSAGSGQLARRALRPDRRYCKNRVTVVELQSGLAADLQRSSLYTRVLARDFLAMPAEPRFDRVVMNPPFDRLRDVDHVNHALGFLKPGGRLVAIMSASSEFSAEAKAITFRKRIVTLGGRWRDLTPGSFKEAGTNVNTRLLVVRVPQSPPKNQR